MPDALLGERKGDAVAVFTPNLAEAVIAVLACFRIGALFNTVFSGFSARSLRDRLESYQPKVIVTADGAFRRGRVVPLKETVDAETENPPEMQRQGWQAILDNLARHVEAKK